MDSATASIDDKYGFQQPQSASDLASKDTEDKRDLQTIKREDFLSIVKDDSGAIPETNDDDMPNIDRDGVKFKRDQEEFRLKTSAQDGRKPLIQELSSTAALPSETNQQQESKPEQVPFSWSTATQVELKPQFIA